MNVGIIDADLIERKKHRFPNLASMKISSWHNKQGDNTQLILDWKNIKCFDKVYISKVFTDTKIPDNVIDMPNVYFGGTGFYFDKAPNLPKEIEHQMPNYHLYDDWIEQEKQKEKNKKITKGLTFNEHRFMERMKEYTSYSIGFLSRGCFRKCEFCVNQKYDHAFNASELEEFYDPTRKKICLLDDNFFAYSKWKKLLIGLQETGKQFKFKQGLDERLLTEEKCELLFSSKYDGDFTFAFDNIKDYNIIKQKLKMIRKYTDKPCKFYLFCGFDRSNKWDNTFWYNDIVDIFKRIELLLEYKCLPYIMRFNRYEESPYRGMYITLARWCNQPGIFKNKTFAEFCSMQKDSERYLAEFTQNTNFGEQYGNYLKMKFNDFKNGVILL